MHSFGFPFYRQPDGPAKGLPRRSPSIVHWTGHPEPGIREREGDVEIDELRKRIDLLDDVLVRIFNERARLALEIGHHKKRLGLPVYDPAREKQIFSRMRRENPGPLDDGAIVRLFERVVDESRRLERTNSQKAGKEEC